MNGYSAMFVEAHKPDELRANIRPSTSAGGLAVGENPRMGSIEYKT